jgi:hypothetical protein
MDREGETKQEREIGFPYMRPSAVSKKQSVTLQESTCRDGANECLDAARSQLEAGIYTSSDAELFHPKVKG